MITKKIIIGFVVVFFIAIACYLKFYFDWEHFVEVADVAQTQTITLLEKDKKRSVYGINILITGYIDGTASIQRFTEGKEIYGPSMIKGKVNLRLGGDWYEDKCLIVYNPSDVKSGKLQIRYKFETL